MPRPLPVPDAPICQLRYATGNLLVDRYQILTTDIICISVWELRADHSTVASYDTQDFPEHFVCPQEHLRELNGRQYANFGKVTGERARAAISEAFPGWQAEQTIPNSVAQARAENWARCSPNFRAIATAWGSCPACGTRQANASPDRCATCRDYDFPIIP